MQRGTGHTLPRFAWLGLYAERVLLVVVLLVAIFLRLYNLETLPRGLLYDEAYNGIDALKILEGERPIFLTGNFGREALFVYLQAFSVALLGQTSFALRVVSAAIGILTVVAAYLLVRRMFSARVALLTCGWLTISLWHIIFSRTGLRSVSLPLFLAIGFYCLWRGLQGVSAQPAIPSDSTVATNYSRPAIWFALGGMMIGLSLYTYSTARFAPFVIATLALYFAVLHRQHLRRVMPGLALALIFTTVVFIPEGLFFVHHPESFVERAQDVSILNPNRHDGNPGQALLDSAIRTLGAFAVRGDGAVDRNIPARPIFDPLSALLMLLGLGLAVRRFRQPAYGIIIIWLVVMFVPSLIAIADAPNHLRITGLIPALFVLPALGTAWLWDKWESRAPTASRKLPILIVTIALLGGSFYAYHSYFVVWPKQPAYSRVFSADKVETLEVALRIVSTEHEQIFVASSDYDDPWVRFTLTIHPESRYVRTFDYVRSFIFPADRPGAKYLFTPDLPHASIIDKYFARESTQIVETALSGRRITSRRLLDPRPSFQPELPVQARIGDQLFVYGFDMPKDVRAGRIMTVLWYWRILTTDERDFSLTNQLFGGDDQIRGQYDARGFAPGYWPAGTSGITTFEIDIDPEAPTGAYWLRVAMYDRNSQEIENLPVFDTEGNQAGNQLILGPIKLHGRPPDPSSEGLLPDPQVPDYPLPAGFADQIDLLGYNLPNHALVPGQTLNLTLYWTPRGRPTKDYTVFVHLLDSHGQLQGQADSPPTSGKYPTSVWDAGEYIADLHSLSIPPNLPAGEYQVAIGLYDPLTGQRLPILDETGQVTGDHLTISSLVVETE